VTGTSIDFDKRAGSPEDPGRDERAEDSYYGPEGHRSVSISVTPRLNGNKKGEEPDLSAESKNKDVEKIEY
jgi:hypothetical protein